jgi:hypothetical protein
MTMTLYDNFLLRQVNGSPIDLDSDTIKAIILTASYTPDRAAHAVITDLNLGANQVSGTNYTAGGITCAGLTLTLVSGEVRWAHNDIVIAQSGSGFSTGRTIVWARDTGTPSTSGLIGYEQLGSDFGNVAGPLTIRGATSGRLIDFTRTP